MKNMKKVFYVLALTAFFLVGTNVSAMTKQDLKSKLTNTYTIGEKEISAPANMVTELERYLNKYDLSSTDCDYIASKFDEALAIVQEVGVTNYTALSDSAKSKLTSIVSDISKNTSVKVTLTKGGKLTVYESDGKTVFTVISDKDNGIQNTNNNNLVIVIASAISLLGVVVIAKKMAGTNA